jgi:hypothetical protein
MSPKDEPSPQPRQAPQPSQPQSSGDHPGELEAYCARRGLTVGAALRAFLRDRLNSKR